MKTVFKWLNHVVSTILIVLLVTVAGLVMMTKMQGGAPEVAGYQLKTVLSGSMEPEIQTGSVIAVKTLRDQEKNNLKVGDVITFLEMNDKLITHRIIDVKQSADGALYITKGDNNNGQDRDPVLAANVIASYEGFTIPYIGYIASFAQSPNGALAFLILPGILMVGYSFITITLVIRRLDMKKENEQAEVK